MKKVMFYTLLLLGLLGLVACAPTQQTDTGVTITSEVDPNVYTIKLTMEQDLESYTVGHAYVSGSSINGVGSVSGRYWEDGKGILRGLLGSVDPAVDFAQPGDTIVIKTTDRKVMGLIPGDTVTFACTADFEPVCAINETNSTQTGKCVEIWEFDYCRIMDIDPAPKPTAIPGN